MSFSMKILDVNLMILNELRISVNILEKYLAFKCAIVKEVLLSTYLRYIVVLLTK